MKLSYRWRKRADGFQLTCHLHIPPFVVDHINHDFLLGSVRSKHYLHMSASIEEIA